MQIWIINLFSDLPGEGAGEGRFLTLAKVFAGMGHEVTWWTMDFHHRSKSHRSEATRLAAENELQTLGLDGRIQIRMVPVSGYKKNISFQRIHSHRQFAAQLLKQAGQSTDVTAPDRIVVSSPPLTAGAAALKLGKRYICPVALDLTDQWPHTFERVLPGGAGLRKRLGRLVFYPQYRLAAHLYRKAALVSAVSQEYLDEVTQRVPAQKTHLCYIGGTECRVSLGGTTEGPPLQIIYVGAMTGSYDLQTALHAMAQMDAQETPAAHLHFAGGGPNEPALRVLSKELGLESRVSFHGFLQETELHELLNRMDVGLNLIRPGIAITMPHKLSDYLCAGLPVINSLAGEADELLREANCGTFYTAGGTKSLLAAIRGYADVDRLNRAKEAAAALAARAFNRAQTYPEWARAVVEL